MKLIEAEVDIDRAAEIIGTTAEFIRSLVDEGVVRCGSGNRLPLKFSELVMAYAVSNFRKANNGLASDASSDAASICIMPMMAFASHLAEARYGFTGSVVRTTHSSHVPERYVIMSNNIVCRAGTLEQYERSRADEPSQNASIYVFDTKAAAEYLVTAIRTCPFRWVEA